jgi:hypothetical protein
MKRKILWVVTAVLVVGLATLSIIEWSMIRGLRREVREALYAAIRPIRLANCTLERFGSPHDGGYVMCGNLLGEVQSAYSYGIAGDDNWGCDISRKYHVAAHEYDCFDPRRPTCPGGALDFHDECVGAAAARTEGRAYDTVANQIGRNGDAGKRLVVKMDVENAELKVLVATPDEVLGRIDQLVVEFHRIDEPEVLQVIDKLKRHFHVAYVHGNNWACRWGAPPLPCGANEILFVNRRLAVLEGGGFASAAPSPLAVTNYPDLPECQPTWP